MDETPWFNIIRLKTLNIKVKKKNKVKTIDHEKIYSQVCLSV